jgi:hypothetical protein
MTEEQARAVARLIMAIVGALKDTSGRTGESESAITNALMALKVPE